MARDSKLIFSYTTAGASLPALAITGGVTGGGTVVFSGAASVWAKGTSNALNTGGFRNMLANTAQMVAGGDATAIASDPAISGNMGAEWYLRLTVSQTSFVLGAGSAISIFVEAASDSGSGAAGTDWTPVSAGVAVTTAFTGTKLIACQLSETAKPWLRVVVQVLHGTVASTGSLVISNAALTLGRDTATHAITL
jgi:hypothetical protein